MQSLEKENNLPGELNAPSNEAVSKHALQNSWTLWYLENNPRKNWKDMLHKITSFDTVEDYWSLFHHIKLPSQLPNGSDYSLFKLNVEPMWEDPANRQGGRWIITLDKSSPTDLDNLWADVLLCLIGENFQHSSQICGAVVNVRQRNDKISIWTSDGDDGEAVKEIGKKLKEVLLLGHNQLQYQLHRDAITQQKGNFRAVYTL